MTTVAAVPVKDLTNAKQRLAAVLSAAERTALAAAMLRDVLRALTASAVDAIWVVTRDAEVAVLAREAGAEPLPETDNHGHTAAVALAQQTAAARGAAVFLTVPGDVPCVGSDEITELLRAGTALAAQGQPAGVFVPSRSGLGTNGVVLTPPAAMSLTFGEPSFQNHLAAARERGVGSHVLKLPRLGLDIDDPDDLLALAAEGSQTESGQLLTHWQVAARLTTALHR